MLRSCFLSNFFESRSAVSEEKSKCVSQSWAMAAIFFLPISPKNTNLVKDVEILLPVKYRRILFIGFREEVENVSANQRLGRPSCFSDRPKKHKLGRGRWDLASCQVSLNSVQRFQRRSWKCESLQTDRRTDGRCAMTIAHLSLRLRWAKNNRSKLLAVALNQCWVVFNTKVIYMSENDWNASFLFPHHQKPTVYCASLCYTLRLWVTTLRNCCYSWQTYICDGKLWDSSNQLVHHNQFYLCFFGWLCMQNIWSFYLLRFKSYGQGWSFFTTL